MNLSKKLSELVSTYMSLPDHISEPRFETEFVMSGLRAANSANLITRRKILSDVSDVLNCEPEDLEFLYTDFATSNSYNANYEVMVPDFQSELLAIAE